MRLYAVSVPIAGFATVVVEADSPESARELALENLDEPEVTWDFFETLCQGNVLYASRYNEIEVHEVDAEEHGE